MLSLPSHTYEKCNKALLITGSARSGTTILSKLIHSFQGVECSFEPPVLFSLFASIDKIDAASWKLLYETYLYEEFFVNALAGRSINCNQCDDSSIFRVKGEAEVQERLEKSLSKLELESQIDRRVLAFKIPDIVGFLPQLQRYYPDTRIIAMTRRAPEVFNSLLVKGWFKDEVLQHSNVIWPSYQRHRQKVPFWVTEADAELWLEMDELNRIGYYYVLTNRPLSKLNNLYLLKYQELLKDADKMVRDLADQFDLEYGEKTTEIVASISRKTEPADDNLLQGLKPALKEEVLHYSSLS